MGSTRRSRGAKSGTSGEALAGRRAPGGAYGGETPPLPLPPEGLVGVVGLVVVVEVLPVVVGEVVFVVEPVLVPVVVELVVVVGEVSEEAVEAVEEELLLLLLAMTTTATTSPMITAIRPAISRWMFPYWRPPSGPRPSGPIMRVGSSCT